MNRRITDEERGLTGSHPERKGKYASRKPLPKRAELESIFSDLLERRAACMADLEASGFVSVQERCLRGQLYRTPTLNPTLRIVQTTERQLVELAKVFIVADAAESQPGKKSDEELLASASKIIDGAN